MSTETMGLPLAVLVLGIVVAGMMGWIANLGGQIRHSEIRPGASATTEGSGHTVTRNSALTRRP